MKKSRAQLKEDYIKSLDSFIESTPVVGQLDTAKFRDFLIVLVEHESGYNPTARQGSYFGGYQTNKKDADPYMQHLNAFKHLNQLFQNTITKADVTKARQMGIKDSALMLKYGNQGNFVNNYLGNNTDHADGLGTKISVYGNDLTMPLDVYNYAMDNLYGEYTVKSGDAGFNIQKKVRLPGRNYATAGKDLWDMQHLTTPYGSIRIGQMFDFGKKEDNDPEYDMKTAIKVLPENLVNAWRNNPKKNHLPSGYTDEFGNGHALKSTYHDSGDEERDGERDGKHHNILDKYLGIDNGVEKFITYNRNPFTLDINEVDKYQQGGLIYKPFYPDADVKSRKQDDSEIDSDLQSYITRYSNIPVESVKIYHPKTDELGAIKSEDVDTTTSNKGKQYKSSEKQLFKQDMYNAYYSALIEKGLNEKQAEEFAKRITTQDINESNGGQSGLSKDFNFGGIKDFSGNGTQKDTVEYINGIRKTMKQPFRKFGDLQEYINYKIDLLNNNGHIFDFSPDYMFKLIVSGNKKYATDPNYASKLENLYKRIG